MLLLSGYSFLQREVVGGILAPRLFKASRWKDPGLAARAIQAPSPGKRRIWFHAASVGELEALWSVISGAATAGHEIVVTIFSDSAKGHLSRLEPHLREKGVEPVFCGFSPWEGAWLGALQKVRPSLFVTAKYEAWPELWCGLALESIPLAIIGARPRRSLRIARKAARILVGRIPELHFLATQESEAQALSREFPGAECRALGDPRWDRLFDRKSRASARVAELLTLFQELPRPWGVLGSVWREDLELWGRALSVPGGSLWIVPHDISPASVAVIREELEAAGVSYAVSSEIRGKPLESAIAVLVNEMGFLAELYSLADWAYVGGGFSKGVHSTMEPAIYGIPVCCGPAGAHRFQEIEDLQATGQLTVARSAEELASWAKRLSAAGELGSRRERWLAEAAARRGATARVLAALEQVCRSREA